MSLKVYFGSQNFVFKSHTKWTFIFLWNLIRFNYKMIFFFVANWMKWGERNFIWFFLLIVWSIFVENVENNENMERESRVEYLHIWWAFSNWFGDQIWRGTRYQWRESVFCKMKKLYHLCSKVYESNLARAIFKYLFLWILGQFQKINTNNSNAKNPHP